MRFRIDAPEPERELLIAELYALGTLGVEESDGALLAYFEGDTAWPQILALRDSTRQIRVRGPEEVAPEDWSRRWREGLGPRELAGVRLRPSWAPAGPGPELVLDPEQAFGSGEHATTRLALTLALEGLAAGDSVLDLGTGSGILALAALRRGARYALGVDNDPVACRTAAGNARRNRLALALACGTIDALDPARPFDLVIANLLPVRLVPLVAGLATRTGRALVLSGFLAADEARVLDALPHGAGLRAVARLQEPQGDDTWGGVRLEREL